MEDELRLTEGVITPPAKELAIVEAAYMSQGVQGTVVFIPLVDVCKDFVCREKQAHVVLRLSRIILPEVRVYFLGPSGGKIFLFPGWSSSA